MKCIGSGSWGLEGLQALTLFLWRGPHFWRITNNFILVYHGQLIRTYKLYFHSNESVGFPAFNFAVCVTNFFAAAFHLKSTRARFHGEFQPSPCNQTLTRFIVERTPDIVVRHVQTVCMRFRISYFTLPSALINFIHKSPVEVSLSSKTASKENYRIIVRIHQSKVVNTDLKKRLDRASIVWKMKPENCSSVHLTRTQKPADPSEESMRNHLIWIARCKFKDFWATWRYAFNMLLIYDLYSSYQ